MTEPSIELAAIMHALENQIDAHTDGLPEEVFLFVSRITPLINVDLLIQDDTKGTLLTWRHDRFYGPGWHVPGGIIRHKETAAERIRIVAKRELGASVEFAQAPILVQESIDANRRDRGHLISLLYRCRLTSDLDDDLRASANAPLPNRWRWHERCPENLISEQSSYAAFMG